MTDKRTLANTIARAIADQIESSRSIIVQNMADVIHDALLLDEAKQDDDPVAPELKNWWGSGPLPDANPEPHSFRKPPVAVVEVVDWGSLKNWWQDENDAYEAKRGGDPIRADYLETPFRKLPVAGIDWWIR